MNTEHAMENRNRRRTGSYECICGLLPKSLFKSVVQRGPPIGVNSVILLRCRENIGETFFL
jgi:hypothetical protein